MKHGRRRFGLILALCAALLALYLAFWPVPIRPVAWQAPLPPPTEQYPQNGRLRDLERLADGVGVGPEGLAIDTQGRLYAGYEDGRVMRFDLNGEHGEVLADTGGRPLGISVGAKGVFVADAMRGLLQIEDGGAVKVLSTGADGVPFRFVDDVDQSAADPYVYFSDASARFGYRQAMADVLEHGDSGRLLRYDLQTGETRTLLRGLHFANGVAVGPRGEYVLVSEMAAYRVLRYWIKGERAGQHEVFVDNLPGFPDNLSIDHDHGCVWLALYAPRLPQLDAMAAHPGLRTLLYRVPTFLWPKLRPRSWALSFDFNGRLLQNLQYEAPPEQIHVHPAYGPVTSVVHYGGTLYFGSVADTAIGRLAMPTAAPHAP
ncbi:SMP-30/gluconolactonase/LRE family protein [Solimonas flava]|uniref:SMP-30/gluconolactonase/LRE family protein n=1 Tax=Solimonas flava TaxID=415849 RepID=UPI000407A2A2|nr:SMP-30/gluconolactonase/LRE family protein [Solimonas flava]